MTIIRSMRVVSLVAKIDVVPALRRVGSRELYVTVDIPVKLVELARREVESWKKSKRK